MTAHWHRFLLVFALLLGLTGLAQAARGPDQVIREAVDYLTQRIDQERERFQQDPAYTRQVVSEELEKLVDFRRVTRLIMGEHFNQATREQRNQFLARFKGDLIRTYSSGITLYTGQPIRVLPLGEGDVRGERARVRMELTTDSGSVVQVAYTLFQSDGTWKVDNVIVNGFNLGSVFRSQFQQAMAAHGNDMDQVIASWSADVKVEELRQADGA